MFFVTGTEQARARGVSQAISLSLLAHLPSPLWRMQEEGLEAYRTDLGSRCSFPEVTSFKELPSAAEKSDKENVVMGCVSEINALRHGRVRPTPMFLMI